MDEHREDSSLEETSMNMDPKLAAFLAYLFGWISGLIFYLIESKNKYVRFHALQSILFNVAAFAILIAVSIIAGILGVIPGLGILIKLLAGLTSTLLSLGFFALWIVLMIKAYQGEKFKLPVIGNIADQNA